MTGFLIGTISDLSHVASISICFLTVLHNEKSREKKDFPGLRITMMEVSSPSTPTMDYCRSLKMNSLII